MSSRPRRRISYSTPTDPILADGRETDIVIFVVGDVGSGKTLFINKLLEEVGDERRMGSPGDVMGSTKSFKSVALTEESSKKLCNIPGKRVVAVDTPGFRDDEASDKNVLEEISRWLSEMHRKGMIFGGIIYLHDSSRDRLTHSSQMNMVLVHEHMGAAYQGSLVLVTSHRQNSFQPDISAEELEKREGKISSMLRSAIGKEGTIIEKFVPNGRSEDNGAWRIVYLTLCTLKMRIAETVAPQTLGTLVVRSSPHFASYALPAPVLAAACASPALSPSPFADVQSVDAEFPVPMRPRGTSSPQASFNRSNRRSLLLHASTSNAAHFGRGAASALSVRTSSDTHPVVGKAVPRTLPPSPLTPSSPHPELDASPTTSHLSAFSPSNHPGALFDSEGSRSYASPQLAAPTHSPDSESERLIAPPVAPVPLPAPPSDPLELESQAIASSSPNQIQVPHTGASESARGLIPTPTPPRSSGRRDKQAAPPPSATSPESQQAASRSSAPAPRSGRSVPQEAGTPPAPAYPRGSQPAASGASAPAPPAQLRRTGAVESGSLHGRLNFEREVEQTEIGVRQTRKNEMTRPESSTSWGTRAWVRIRHPFSSTDHKPGTDRRAIAIIILGHTGAGMSTFINEVFNNKRKCPTGNEGVPCTHTLQVCKLDGGLTERYRYKSLEGRDILLIDTPGLNNGNPANTDRQTFKQIAKWLKENDKAVVVGGIVFLYQITETSFGDNATRARTALFKMCGEKGMPRVVLATCKWDNVLESVGIQTERETELKTSIAQWGTLIGRCRTTLVRWNSQESDGASDHSSATSAWGIVDIILKRLDGQVQKGERLKPLQIQKEMSTGFPIKFYRTEVGRFLRK